MTEPRNIYRCAVCGNIVELLIPATGTLTCCGQPVRQLRENTTDGAREKHVPMIEPIDGGYRVTVGSMEHPMTPAHYIQWIELCADNEVQRKFLNPSDRPVAEFRTNATEVTAREYCNLHGLWRG